jgi:hypothetical protein
MRRLRKFLSLSGIERRLLLSALFVTAGVRLGLWLLPFQTLRRLLSRRTQRAVAQRAREEPAPERITWAVRAASRYVPRATCLTQALAAWTLLTRNGYAAHVLFGVAKDRAKRLEAHSWLECQGRVLIGESNLSRYTPLITTEESHA